MHASDTGHRKARPGDKIDADGQHLLGCIEIDTVDVPRLGDAQGRFKELVLHPYAPRQDPSCAPAWQDAARPSRTLCAAARWPAAILDHRTPPCPGQGRSGRTPHGFASGFLCLSRFFPSDFAWAPRLIFQAQATSKGGYQDSGPLSKNASAGFLLPRPSAVEPACSRSGHRKPLARYGAMEGALRSRLATPGASNLEAD